MNLFSFLNNGAGQSVFLDAAMRFFYVASVPLAATLWLALLFFRRESRIVSHPHQGEARMYEYSSRRAVVAATFFALVICAALWFAFSWFVQQVLQTPILSPRPFVTRWVNLLVVEPNDNSFPSPEAILLGVFWIASWALAPRAFWAAFALAMAGCVARVFCGTHYVADVVVGWGIGAAICAFSMAVFGVVLRLSPRPFRQRAWRLRVQGAAGATVVLAVVIFGISTLRQTPRLLVAWQERGSASQIAASPQRLRDIEYSNEYAKKALHEGEGAPMEKPRAAPSSSDENIDAHGKAIPRVGVTTTGGWLPREEARLLRALQRFKLAHSLVSVEVASLRDNVSRDEKNEGFAMHFAAVRFHIRKTGAAERRRAAQTAQRIVQIAFASDSALQSVDVTGVVLNDPARDGVRYPVFAVGAIPVWTASIQRADLVSKKFASVLNAPNADAGLWLRARSRIYINERVLPSRDAKVGPAPVLFVGAPTPSPSLPLKGAKGDELEKSNTHRIKTVAPKPLNAKVPQKRVLPTSPKLQTPPNRTSSTRSSAKTPQKPQIGARKKDDETKRAGVWKAATKRGANTQKPQWRKAPTPFRARGER